jgi:hypothetical protein
MKINLKLLIVALGLLISGALATSAMAQGVDPLDANSRRNQDPFSNTDNGYEPFFDMMHRVQLGNVRSVSEYSKDQQENIGSQASDFRERQRLLMQQGQNPTGTTGTTGTATPVEPQPTVPAEPISN